MAYGNGSETAALREEVDDYRGEVLRVSGVLALHTDKLNEIVSELRDFRDEFEDYKERSNIQEIRNLKAQLKAKTKAEEKRIDWVKTVIGGVIVGVGTAWVIQLLMHR